MTKTTNRETSVVIDARACRTAPNGLGKHVEALAELIAENRLRLTLLTDGPFHDHYAPPASARVVTLASTGRWNWEQRVVRDYLRRERPGVYIAASNRGLPLARLPQTACLLVLHDVIPWILPHLFFWQPPRFWCLRHEALPQLAAIFRADHILTVSNTSRRDIRRLAPGKSITVLPHRLRAAPLPPRDKPASQFVYVGGVDRRKRTAELLIAFGRFHQTHPHFRLILIGSGYSTLTARISQLGLTNAVRITGAISDEHRDKLINQSAAMIYPSLYEGFGLALAEAMGAGTPVIAGKGGAQPEVAGPAALYVNPRDPDSILAAMHAVLRPKVRTRLLKAREREIPRLFDPEISARTIALIERLVRSE